MENMKYMEINKKSMEKGVDIISTILWPAPIAILRKKSALDKSPF